MSLHFRGWDVTCETCANPLSTTNATTVRTKTALRAKAKNCGWRVNQDWTATCADCLKSEAEFDRWVQLPLLERLRHVAGERGGHKRFLSLDGQRVHLKGDNLWLFDIYKDGVAGWRAIRDGRGTYGFLVEWLAVKAGLEMMIKQLEAEGKLL